MDKLEPMYGGLLAFQPIPPKQMNARFRIRILGIWDLELCTPDCPKRVPFVKSPMKSSNISCTTKLHQL